jgi:Arc/MetJ family transcription regulator
VDRAESAVVGHPQCGGGSRAESGGGQHSRDRGGVDTGVLGRNGDRYGGQVRVTGAPAVTNSSPDALTMEPSARTAEESSPAASHAVSIPARRLWSRAGAKSTSEANSAGSAGPAPCHRARGEGQFRGVADLSQVCGSFCDAGSRAFQPQGRRAQHGLERGDQIGDGSAGFGDPSAGDLTQLGTTRIRPRRNRQPTCRPTGFGRRHGRRMGREQIGPGQDDGAVPFRGLFRGARAAEASAPGCRSGSAGPGRVVCRWRPVALSAYTADGLRIYILEGISPVTKRLIDLDDELLASAQRELNTTGVSDTVRAALQQAASAAARARQLTWLRDGGLEAMADPAQRADVWR